MEGKKSLTGRQITRIIKDDISRIEDEHITDLYSAMYHYWKSDKPITGIKLNLAQQKLVEEFPLVRDRSTWRASVFDKLTYSDEVPDGEMWFLDDNRFNGNWKSTNNLKEVNQMADACKCDDCGTLAEEMEGQEDFIFRSQNGDHKLRLNVQFLRPKWPPSGLCKDLCLSCKINYLKRAIEQLKKKREGGEK